jgi:hypothetical protein
VGASVGRIVGVAVGAVGAPAGAVVGRFVGTDVWGDADGEVVGGSLLTRLGVGVDCSSEEGDNVGSTTLTGATAGAGVAAGWFVGLNLVMGLRVGRAMMGRPVGVAGAFEGLSVGTKEAVNVSFLNIEGEMTTTAAATIVSATMASDHSKRVRRVGRFFFRSEAHDAARVALLVLPDGSVMSKGVCGCGGQRRTGSIESCSEARSPRGPRPALPVRASARLHGRQEPDDAT